MTGSRWLLHCPQPMRPPTDSESQLQLSCPFQRASAAARAICFRRAGDNCFARALPPFLPPSRPSATAAGFLPDSSNSSASPTDRSTISFPSWLVSLGRLLERSGMGRIWHESRGLSPSRQASEVARQISKCVTTRGSCAATRFCP